MTATAPYVGLATFQPDDAERFFGRERLVDELVVVGPVRFGKSSLLAPDDTPRTISAIHPPEVGSWGGGSARWVLATVDWWSSRLTCVDCG